MVRSIDGFPSDLLSLADSNRAFAMIAPPDGPSPLLFNLRTWNVRFSVRKGTIGSADRPPKALSLRSSSTREVWCFKELQIAASAWGISVISRPVKTSAKSATWRGYMRYNLCK